ncbi:hypothetical protein BpHYR1_033958 [Brachionus plicatilis]|uniref:Uncharacterized protein n=1 Tax=Brachionus plicatilis TaxID=10195 RepID=A0A3M7PF64_BRAPC|nr:hypothetical protein BpHYR1_033958 [Brachionus plicatilis]
MTLSILKKIKYLKMTSYFQNTRRHFFLFILLGIYLYLDLLLLISNLLAYFLILCTHKKVDVEKNFLKFLKSFEFNDSNIISSYGDLNLELNQRCIIIVIT